MGARQFRADRSGRISTLGLCRQAIMADIVIINPRFDISFWGMEHCIGLLVGAFFLREDLNRTSS